MYELDARGRLTPMSTTFPVIELPDGSRKIARKLTYREARYIQERLKPEITTKAEAARNAGFPQWMIHEVNRVIEVGEVAALLQELRSTLAEHAIDVGLIDATEIHQYLTDAIRADWCDIELDDGTFRPISEWPPIWRQMKEAGDVEIEYESRRSHDGEDKDGLGGWDRDGIVKKVKIKFASRVKLLELAMRHKAVNAMVEQKGADVHLHLHAEMTAKLQAALTREARLIETTASESDRSTP